MRGLKRPPSPSQLLKSNRVNIPNMSEAIWNPLYDYQPKTAAAASQQRFFQVPIGQGGKEIQDTNMELAGNLPAGQRFLITGVQVEFFPDLPVNGTDASAYANDIKDFYSKGALELTIGSKKWIRQGNLLKFAPVNFIDMESSTTVSTDRYVIASAKGREFAVNGLTLESSQNFNVDLIGLSATSTTGRIGVTLNGWQYRNAQ